MRVPVTQSRNPLLPRGFFYVMYNYLLNNNSMLYCLCAALMLKFYTVQPPVQPLAMCNLYSKYKTVFSVVRDCREQPGGMYRKPEGGGTPYPLPVIDAEPLPAPPRCRTMSSVKISCQGTTWTAGSVPVIDAEPLPGAVPISCQGDTFLRCRSPARARHGQPVPCRSSIQG